MTELIKILKNNQHDKTQPPHLSPSSISLHMRCPRQWQRSYVFGQKGSKSDALVIGSGVHLAISRILMGRDIGNWWQETLEADEYIPDDSRSKAIAEAMVYHYYETIGKYLTVLATERELLVNVPGVDIPVLGYLDIETPERLIDLKSTRYFSRKGVRLNKEWKFAQGIYQLEVPKPSEIHVLTRSKSDPVVVPDSTSHPLHIGLVNAAQVVTIIRDEWNRMQYHWDKYGEAPWPGNVLHDWNHKYCGVPNCCKL